MLVISNNCCGGRFYNRHNLEFNNPFIWMVCPNDSIMYVMNNFNKINWFNYDFEKSTLKKNTYIIKVENVIELHYVHYNFDSKATKLYTNKDTNEVYYCRIWEYINQKYLDRVQRMLECKDKPIFLIRDEAYANSNSKYSIKDIAYNNSDYKRIIITKDKSVTRNDELCKTILVNKIELPLTTINKYYNSIISFIN